MVDWIGVIGISAQIAGVVILSEPLWYKLARQGDPTKARIQMDNGKPISFDFYLAVKKRALKGIPLIIGGMVLQIIGLLTAY